MPNMLQLLYRKGVRYRRGVAVGGVVLVVLALAAPALSRWAWEEFRLMPTVAYALNTGDARLAESIANYHFNWNVHAPAAFDRETARTYYERARQARPEFPFYSYTLGLIDFIDGRFSSAAEQLTRAHDLAEQLPKDEPERYWIDFRSHYSLGLVYAYADRLERSDEAFSAAIATMQQEDVVDEHWAPYVDLAWVYLRQEQYERMRETMAPVVSEYPDNSWVLNMHGLALLHTGAPAEAATHFRRARDAVETLTPRTWAATYPGNHPRAADEQIARMRTLIEQNLERAVQRAEVTPAKE